MVIFRERNLVGGGRLVFDRKSSATWYLVCTAIKKTNHRTHKTCTGINETKKTKLSRSLGPSPWPEVIFYLLFFWGLSRSCNIKKNPGNFTMCRPTTLARCSEFFLLVQVGWAFFVFFLFVQVLWRSCVLFSVPVLHGAAINHVGDNRTANVHRTPSNIYNQWGPILIAKLTFSRPLPIDYFAAQFALYDLVW